MRSENLIGVTPQLRLDLQEQIMNARDVQRRLGAERKYVQIQFFSHV